MPTYSKAHERDENRLMNKAFTRSLIALILCWLPLVGLIFAVSGFLRMVVRLTHKHRAKCVMLTIFSVISMLLSIGVLGWEVYEYARDPNIIDTGVRLAWKALTGEENPPWAAEPSYDPGMPDDDASGYGHDPYANQGTGDEDDDSHSGGDEYDSDFDDSELEGFEEEVTSDLPEKDLFDQMMAEQKTGGISRLP